MFCILTKKNKSLGIRYVEYIREKLSNDKSEQLRKYLKAAKDLMKIDDGDQEIRVK
jgi:thermostable 8-oxoguanine DNA glycosylase